MSNNTTQVNKSGGVECSTCGDRFDTKAGLEIHKSLSHEREWDDEQYLRREYLERGKGMREIAEENGANYRQIRRRIKKYGIETRNSNNTRYFGKDKRLGENKDEIIEKYTVEKRPAYEIGEEYGVGDNTIRNKLEEWGIEIRSQKEQLLADTNPKLKSKEWLKREYREKERYTPELADELGVSETTVYNALKRNGVEIFEHSKTISGEKCYLYKGGEWNSKYGSGWYKTSRKVRKRDGKKCQDCGKPQSENGRKLDVHHIIPKRKFENKNKANEMGNLVALCRSCHRKWEGIPLKPQ